MQLSSLQYCKKAFFSFQCELSHFCSVPKGLLLFLRVPLKGCKIETASNFSCALFRNCFY